MKHGIHEKVASERPPKSTQIGVRIEEATSADEIRVTPSRITLESSHNSMNVSSVKACGKIIASIDNFENKLCNIITLMSTHTRNLCVVFFVWMLCMVFFD